MVSHLGVAENRQGRLLPVPDDYLDTTEPI